MESSSGCLAPCCCWRPETYHCLEILYRASFACEIWENICYKPKSRIHINNSILQLHSCISVAGGITWVYWHWHWKNLHKLFGKGVLCMCVKYLLIADITNYSISLLGCHSSIKRHGIRYRLHVSWQATTLIQQECWWHLQYKNSF